MLSLVKTKGLEAIHDHVFAGLTARDANGLRVPWLQSSDLVERTLDTLLAVFPATPTEDASWGVNRRRAHSARASGVDPRGLPTAEVGEVVGRCERDPLERDPVLRLTWSARGQARSDPTPWTDPMQVDYEVTADAELELEGAFLAEAGVPASANFHERWTFTRHFDAEQGARTSTHRVELDTRLRVAPD